MDRPLDRIYQRLLVLRCQTGDEAAFAEIVGLYHPRLRRFLRRMLDDDVHAADDALQDVWFDVFRGVGKLRDGGAFAPWLGGGAAAPGRPRPGAQGNARG